MELPAQEISEPTSLQQQSLEVSPPSKRAREEPIQSTEPNGHSQAASQEISIATTSSSVPPSLPSPKKSCILFFVGFRLFTTVYSI